MTRRRLDPRGERTARQQPGTTRPRFTVEAAPPGRPRRDPRAERATQGVMNGNRLRLDRSPATAGGHAVPMPTARPAGQTEPPPVIIDDPAFLILVVADAPGGRLTLLDRQMLGAARNLAAGGGATILLAATTGDEAAAAGADRLAAPAAGHEWDPEGRAAETAALVTALCPRHVLFPETDDGGDLARRVAVLLGEPLFAGAESLSTQVAGRPARGHRMEQRTRPPRLISLVADVIPAHGGARHEARAVAVPPAPAGRAILPARIIPGNPATLSLVEADFVLSAGNGVSDFAGFRALAAALGATPGASRVVCDAGLMPRAAQVGASGSVLGATCYFALGIAGAPQHLQGITRVEHVVAVNTDLHAAMIERAGLAIVADAQAVMPALLAALDKEVQS